MKTIIGLILILVGPLAFAQSPFAGRSYGYHSQSDDPNYLLGFAFFFQEKTFVHMRLRIPKNKNEKKIYFRQYSGTYLVEGNNFTLNTTQATCKAKAQETSGILYPTPNDYFILLLKGEPAAITFKNAEKFESPATTFDQDQFLVEDKDCNIVY